MVSRLLVIKILMLLGATGIMDADGWVSVERPTKTPYVEEGRAKNPDKPEWVAFAKQTGIEKVLVSFPAVPSYLYDDRGIVVFAHFRDCYFQFQIHNQTFDRAENLLDWRIRSLNNPVIEEAKTWIDEDGKPAAELTYWNGKKWVLEWWKSTSENTYCHITETPRKNDEFHRQIVASFDLELDHKKSS